MEYSIIHSDLVDTEIKPQRLLRQYIKYLQADIKKCFNQKKFVCCDCPTNGETKTRESFKKMGMNYYISKTFGNIYISPRPGQRQLIEFYQQSSARKFWLKELWAQTIDARKQKIIRPQLEWMKTFIEQYLNGKPLVMAEYYPNHWGYFEEARICARDWEYYLVRPMFLTNLCQLPHLNKYIIDRDDTDKEFDSICLFDALDRSEDPGATLRWVSRHLKAGGLCFITGLLASGFEIQILGSDSAVFMPPERMNIFSYEGLINLIAKFAPLKILEFSTPGVLDIPNIIYAMKHMKSKIPPFIRYILETRKDPNLLLALQDFLQMNKLSSFGRLVLRKGQNE